MSGKTFNNLTVVNLAERSSTNEVQWFCLCTCGNICAVRASAIVSGKTKSCGCIKSKSLKDSKITHGMTKTKQYRSWSAMMQRCYNEKNTSYDYYGGRGIYVCEKWKDFSGFWEDMRVDYIDGMTLERLDLNSPYNRENCTWISKSQQTKNRSLQSNNELGISNVRIIDKGGFKHMKATIRNTLENKTETKVLSLHKRSYDDALIEITTWLQEKRRVYEYGETHGISRKNS